LAARRVKEVWSPEISGFISVVRSRSRTDGRRDLQAAILPGGAKSSRLLLVGVALRPIQETLFPFEFLLAQLPAIVEGARKSRPALRKHQPEIQYLKASISEEQHMEFGRLVGDRGTSVPPELNVKRAAFVLGKIDEILTWEKERGREQDLRFVDLGRYLCEVRAGQYWRLEKMKSFDNFLEKRFPDSRRKAYYLMAIHENLTRVPKQQLREIGWTKATELAKVARREGERFESATWVHKAQALPKEEFKWEVERHLTGKETGAWEIIYFKLYKSQLPVVEEAIETAGLMLGTDKSRGYCLEMICADFLAGANIEESGSWGSVSPTNL
jgi:hypothetical protein